uniref:Uncharacterized protein n=1 Tax=Arundo donax TaxID=35708 RepID=A0A0A8Y531_ARUDO
MNIVHVLHNLNSSAMNLVLIIRLTKYKNAYTWKSVL